MANMSVGGYGALFSSLSGGYNAMSSMSGVIGNYNQIKSGQYSQLMKAYVKKVGNQAALNAYRSSGTTVQSATEVAADSSSSSTKSTSSTTSASSASKSSKYHSSWLDNNVGVTARANAAKSSATVSKNHNTFLDDHLAQYDSDGSKKTTTETGTSVDTEV